MELQSSILTDFSLREGDGGVDPLPLHRVNERLADRILPQLNERMQRVRFITAMAVGARVCDEFGDNELAADGVTPPWLVFEWYAAEALIRRAVDSAGEKLWSSSERSRGETGARNPRRSGPPLTFKKPRGFGFSSIYKSAAVGMRIITDDHRLGDVGHELVRAWELDQELGGFVDGVYGPGERLRSELARAVERGLTAGHAAAPRSDVYRHLARILCPASIGPRERRVLHRQLRSTESLPSPDDPLALHMRRELVDAVERHGFAVDLRDEAEFLRQIRPSASSALARRLDAIDDYEKLCRPIDHAVSIIQHLGTRLGAVRASDFAAHERSPQLVERVRRAAASLRQGSPLLDWEPDARLLAERFVPVRDASSLFEAIFQQHKESQPQRRTSAEGKWQGADRPPDRLPERRVHARGTDAPAEPPAEPTSYLHSYRTPTLSRFLADLGKLPIKRSGE